MSGKRIIDLRSDTVTRPSQEMLQFMFAAEVGDDVFGDDPTIIKLEEKISSLFGIDSALFCPSGTMANQIAVKAHTSPGDEVVCDIGSHVYIYEGGGIAFNSGCSARLIHGDRGRITSLQVEENINPVNDHFPRTRLVVIENTSNKGGGSCYDYNEAVRISKLCHDQSLKLHLDGARLFNALAEKGNTPKDYGILADSISICLSKGLGAPIGSVLLGNHEFIRQARRIRKVYGGGMRQAGYLAAAGIYALDHNIYRLKEDHRRARLLGEALSKLPYVKEMLPVETNIVVFKLIQEINDQDFISKLKEKEILVTGFGPRTIRMVTHLDFTDEMMARVILELNKMS
jgi:threonine aldolase